MPTIQIIHKKQKHKRRKRKNQQKHSQDIGTPQVPLSKNRHQQRYELLSDWEEAT